MLPLTAVEAPPGLRRPPRWWEWTCNPAAEVVARGWEKVMRTGLATGAAVVFTWGEKLVMEGCACAANERDASSRKHHNRLQGDGRMGEVSDGENVFLWRWEGCTSNPQSTSKVRRSSEAGRN